MSFLESREQLAPRGIWKSVPRREDTRLPTGNGRFTDGFNLLGQVYAYILRSPHAQARIAGIEVTGALAAPGLLAVLIGADTAADGIGPIPQNRVSTNRHEVPLKSRDGSPFFIAPHAVVALDTVRHVGEPIAVVVAETPAQAADAAELVAVELPAAAGGRPVL